MHWKRDCYATIGYQIIWSRYEPRLNLHDVFNDAKNVADFPDW